MKNRWLWDHFPFVGFWLIYSLAMFSLKGEYITLPLPWLCTSFKTFRTSGWHFHFAWRDGSSQPEMHQLFGQLIGVLVFFCFMMYIKGHQQTGMEENNKTLSWRYDWKNLNWKKIHLKVPCTVSLLETLYRITRIQNETFSKSQSQAPLTRSETLQTCTSILGSHAVHGFPPTN